MRFTIVMLCRTVAAVCLAALPAAAQDLTRPLTAAEVECTELQLERLLLRMGVGVLQPPPGRVGNLLVAPGDGASYQGLAASNPSDLSVVAGPEHQLAFHLQVVRPQLVNPARTPLGQVSLTREEPASNLLPSGSGDTMQVGLEPGLPALRLHSLNPPQPPPPPVLVIDNVAGAAGRGTSTLPGRGLAQDGLLSPCTDRLTPFDRHVFALLQRLVRVETRFFISSFLDTASEVAVFRGADPYLYRLNFYGAGAGGRVAVAAVIGWDPDGRLTSAELSILPDCADRSEPGCTSRPANQRSDTRIWLLPPVFGGVEPWRRDDLRAVQLFHNTEAPGISTATADLAALLAGTAWNGGN